MTTVLKVASRKDFPLVLNEMGLLGDAVEVGVHRGSFSAHILQNWEGNRLFSVDPWIYQPTVKLDKSNVDNEEHEECFRATKLALKPFGRRSVIQRTFSTLAADKFHDRSLDFVYLDARHDYRSVTADLAAWWPKIRRGGILAGHDYFDKFLRKNLVEVKRAVDIFFFGKDEVRNTIDDRLPSWYVLKQTENHFIWEPNYPNYHKKTTSSYKN